MYSRILFSNTWKICQIKCVFPIALPNLFSAKNRYLKVKDFFVICQKVLLKSEYFSNWLHVKKNCNFLKSLPTWTCKCTYTIFSKVQQEEHILPVFLGGLTYIKCVESIFLARSWNSFGLDCTYMYMNL